MMEDNAMLLEGTLLDNGHYRIERPLGSGGFGNTYLVTDLRMGMPCMVKEFFLTGVNVRIEKEVTVSVPSNKQTFESQLLKFKKEARRLFMLNNPHIVRIHTLFDENSTSYYVMDYIDGQSLSDIVKQQGHPMTESQVRNILNQILDALQMVHSQQEPLFHLDIKPGNIMLDRSGYAFLIDFGASKQKGVDGGMTSTTTAMSYTPGYAPMEQIEQDINNIGPWTDFYALGATMYHLLTMNRPPSITSLHRADAFVYPPGVSEGMKSLIKKMMALHPQNRPQNVSEIRRALAAPSSPGKPLNDEERTTYRTTQETQRQPQPDNPSNNNYLPWVLAILLAMVIGGGGVWLLTNKNKTETKKTTTTDNPYSRSNDSMTIKKPEKQEISNPQEAQTTTSPAISDDELYGILTGKVAQWDRGHTLGETYHLSSLYADRVHFYGMMCSYEKVIQKIDELLYKTEGFYQNSTNISMSRLSDTSARCDFDKDTYQSNGVEGHYPSYLRFENIDGQWKIVEESDLITDKNLKKIKNK